MFYAESRAAPLLSQNRAPESKRTRKGLSDVFADRKPAKLVSYEMATTTIPKPVRDLVMTDVALEQHSACPSELDRPSTSSGLSSAAPLLPGTRHAPSLTPCGLSRAPRRLRPEASAPPITRASVSSAWTSTATECLLAGHWTVSICHKPSQLSTMPDPPGQTARPGSTRILCLSIHPASAGYSTRALCSLRRLARPL